MKLHTLLPLAALPIVPFLIPHPRSLAPLAPDRDLATLAPTDARVYLEANGLAAIARAGFEHPLAKAVLGAKAVKELLSAGHVDPNAWLRSLDGLAGFEVLPSIAELSARGASLAVAYRRSTPSLLACLRGDDPEKVGARLRAIAEKLAEKAGAPGAFEHPAATVRGADVWRVGEQFAWARRDATVWITNDEAFLRDALELAGDARARGLAGEPQFQSASGSRANANLAWAFADLVALDELAANGKLGDPTGYKNLRTLAAQPAAELILGPGLSSAFSSKTLTLGARVSGATLELALAADGIPSSPAGALRPRANEAAPPPIARERADCEWIAYRDLTTLFQKRTEIFPPEMSPGFAEATTNLGFLFGGMDVGEKIWPALSPWVRVVAREVAFAPAAKPEIPLPAVALVMRVNDAEHNGPLFVSAFQTTFGFLNIERAQQAKPAMALHLEMQDGVQINYAQLAPPKPGAGVDIGYNLEPACALVKDLLVIGTHRALVMQIAKELGSKPGATAPQKSEHLTLVGASIARALEPNVDALVMNAVLKEGKTREEAERNVRALVSIVELVDQLDLDVAYPKDDAVAVDLKLDLAAKE